MPTLENVIVVVNEEPYCFWSTNARGENQEYLCSIDGTYFQSIGNLVIEGFAKEDGSKSHVSTLLRLTYYHALETFFSHICAMLQAPDCVVGWVQKASNQDIRNVVRKIDEKDNSIKRTLDIKEISWESLARSILQVSDTDEHRVEANIKNFSCFWSRIASEYLRPEAAHEYNAMKHGFRVRSGGFQLLFGREMEPGKPPEMDKMKTLTQSDYGSSYFKAEQCSAKSGKNRSYYLKRFSINWSFEATLAKLMIVSGSITNVMGFLKILNGVPREQVKWGPSLFRVGNRRYRLAGISAGG